MLFNQPIFLDLPDTVRDIWTQPFYRSPFWCRDNLARLFGRWKFSVPCSVRFTHCQITESLSLTHAHTWFSFTRLIFQNYSGIHYSRLGNFFGRLLQDGYRSCFPTNGIKALEDDSVPGQHSQTQTQTQFIKKWQPEG